jgi:single-stranded-DNA-specific exonuclease
MVRLEIDRIGQVGNGRHLRLRLRTGKYSFQAIYFSATPETACISRGDLVDVAFTPQINEYRGERSVQMNVVDIRPSCPVDCTAETGNYRALCSGTLTPKGAAAVMPDRETQGAIWRYLAGQGKTVCETPMSLCRKIARWTQKGLSLEKLLICLDIFADVGLIKMERQHKYILIRADIHAEKKNLNLSPTMQRLLQVKER